MCVLLIFGSRSFNYEFGNLLSYFWGNDLCSLSLLIKRFGHFNLSILRISSHFKREFLVNAKYLVVFSVALCGINETSEFSLGGGYNSSILFLVENKYRTEISPKIAKIGETKSWCIWDRLGVVIGNSFFPKFCLNFLCFIRKEVPFMKVNFSFIFVIILKKILTSENWAKIS